MEATSDSLEHKTTLNEDIFCKILTPEIKDYEVRAFVETHNKEWAKLFLMRYDTFRRRLDTGALFVGEYKKDEPIGLLETIAFNVDVPKVEASANINNYPLKMARNVCETLFGKYKDYFGFTDNGLWRPNEENSNVLMMVDITISEKNRTGGAGNKLMDYAKNLFVSYDNPKTPNDLINIEFILTFTPNSEPPRKFQLRNYAFDTGIIQKNARPGYKEHDVAPLCHLAPGYPIQIGQRKL